MKYQFVISLFLILFLFSLPTGRSDSQSVTCSFTLGVGCFDDKDCCCTPNIYEHCADAQNITSCPGWECQSKSCVVEQPPGGGGGGAMIVPPTQPPIEYSIYVLGTTQCGNGVCQEMENEINCPGDCKGLFYVEPKAVRLYVQPGARYTKTIRITNSNETRMIKVFIQGDESNYWVSFNTGVGATGTRYVSFYLKPYEYGDLVINLDIPQQFTTKTYKTYILFTDGMAASTTITISKISYGIPEEFSIAAKDFFSSVLYKFPNEAVPPITGAVLSVMGVSVLSGIGMWWMVAGKRRRMRND